MRYEGNRMDTIPPALHASACSFLPPVPVVLTYSLLAQGKGDFYSVYSRDPEGNTSPTHIRSYNPPYTPQHAEPSATTKHAKPLSSSPAPLGADGDTLLRSAGKAILYSDKSCKSGSGWRGRERGMGR